MEEVILNYSAQEDEITRVLLSGFQHLPYVKVTVTAYEDVTTALISEEELTTLKDKYA